MASTKKLITVFGSTGSQGGSVVEKFLNDPKLKNDWRVRGVTRDVNKESSKKLASKGVEVVSADMDDAKSLTKAMEGSDAVFAVTNYWEYMNREREEKQGRNLVDAAKAAGVKHFIFSSLINATKETNGKLSNIHHFDGKAEVEQYARAAGVPSTFFMPGMYVAAVASMFRKDENGGWTLAFPGPETTSQFPLFQPQDTGMWVKAIVLNKEKVLGGNVRAAAEYITPQQMLATFLKTYPEAGAGARFYEVPKDQYLQILTGKGMPDFAAEELFENMQLLSIGGYYAGAKLSADLLDEGDEAVTFEKWIKTAKEFQGLN